MHNMLESNMDHIFNNRAISEEVRRELETLSAQQRI